MIKRIKNKNKPVSISGVDSPGELETREAINFYSYSFNKDESFDYHVYKSEDIKSLLDTDFYDKCAYCEARYKATSVMDVEHFRPKGRIELLQSRKKITPGYFWLASNWENLFPSCINCNRRQYRKIVGDDTLQMAGKGELFPLMDERKRAKKPGDEKFESPVLINPSDDDPDIFFTFNNDGYIFPKSTTADILHRARITIEILGLQRFDLVDERKAVTKLVLARIKNIIRLDKLCERYPHETEHQDMLNDELRELQDLSDEKNPFTGMVKQLIKANLLF